MLDTSGTPDTASEVVEWMRVIPFSDASASATLMLEVVVFGSCDGILDLDAAGGGAESWRFEC